MHTVPEPGAGVHTDRRLIISTSGPRSNCPRKALTRRAVPPSAAPGAGRPGGTVDTMPTRQDFEAARDAVLWAISRAAHVCRAKDHISPARFGTEREHILDAIDKAKAAIDPLEHDLTAQCTGPTHVHYGGREPISGANCHRAAIAYCAKVANMTTYWAIVNRGPNALGPLPPVELVDANELSEGVRGECSRAVFAAESPPVGAKTKSQRSQRMTADLRRLGPIAERLRASGKTLKETLDVLVSTHGFTGGTEQAVDNLIKRYRRHRAKRSRRST